MEPTKKVVQAEIKKLEHFSKFLKVRVSQFGNDHGETLNTQIAVLEGRLDGDQINNIEEDDLRCAANDALDWLEGTVGEAPSAGWADSPHLFKS